MPTRTTAATLSAQLADFARRPTPEAARALARSGADTALPALVAASQDVMEGELATALRAAVRAVATPELLTRWIADADVARRRVAAHALSARYEAHVPMLAKALSDADDEVRAIARRALASWVRSDALHALFRDLLAHTDPRVRALAAEALGALGDAHDAPLVSAAIAREGDERARHALERAVARLGG
jgi:HEAT repeat protein